MSFRREKELAKALETPEEKRARRLAKKVYIYVHLWISVCVCVCVHVCVYVYIIYIYTRMQYSWTFRLLDAQTCFMYVIMYVISKPACCLTTMIACFIKYSTIQNHNIS